MAHAFVLHGHFYQPPRENPWTEATPGEPSAAPFRDWNSRITAECYRPNGWAHILDDTGEVTEIVDNYRLLSFNVGPTLLSWLEEYAPDVYDRILTADRLTGRAIAQGYGHAILPLSNDRDLRTQIRWGVADFRHRFGREPVGMWLPETAVDERVLAALAEEGIGFTILAPGQVQPVEPGEAHRPVYRWRHPDDPELGVDLVVYEGGLSHDVAFQGVSSGDLLDRVSHAAEAGVAEPDGRPRLVTVACDGETFGHHQEFAERGVAHALAVEAPRRQVAVPCLADWLKGHPPEAVATVVPSSWSCAHGVGRWLEDCGCQTGGDDSWNQRWRAPLRMALDILRDHAAHVFERRGGSLMEDPWAARDAYIDVILGAVTDEEFAARHLRVEVAGEPAALVEALTLLELQRHALLMYTSCGWFFNDLAGIETQQILRYAARCWDLLAELGESAPQEAFLEALAEAESNVAEEGTGRDLWERHVVTARVDGPRVAAHLALAASLVDDLADIGSVRELGGFSVTHHMIDVADSDSMRLVAGRVTLRHRRTRGSSTWAYVAIRERDSSGGGNDGMRALVRHAKDIVTDELAVARSVEAVRRGESPGIVRGKVTTEFGAHTFGPEAAIPGLPLS